LQEAWPHACLQLLKRSAEYIVVQTAVHTIMRFTCRRPQAPSPSAVIEELDSDISSDGTADAVIERDMRYYAASSSASSSSSAAGLPLDMQDLCTLAGRLVSAFCYVIA
jgi:hypothetical protein